LPSETVTLLFSDVEGSTELVKRLQDTYASVLAEHRAVLREVFVRYSGTEVDTQGDSFFVVFAHARDAVMCAAVAQQELSAHAWPAGVPVSVRMGLHTGEVHRDDDNYVGVAVHRAARLCTLAHGGQVVMSRSTAGIVDDMELPGLALSDLGDHLLKGFERPERVFQLVIQGLPSHFPALRTSVEQEALTGTATIVMVEGRRMLRLHRELTPERFGALLGEYRRLVSGVLEAHGGRNTETVADTIVAGFSTAKEAASAAVQVMQAVTKHNWSPVPKVEVSIGIHSGTAGIGWLGAASLRCNDLCDTAEGGQIFLSPTTASLLEDEELGAVAVRDLGEQITRTSHHSVRVFELVSSAADARTDTSAP
jgi:class 3 adenylate cyclase